MFKCLGIGQTIVHQYSQRLYGVCQNILNIVAHRCLDSTMAEYLDKVHTLHHEFNELLPLASCLLPSLLLNNQINDQSSCCSLYMDFLKIIHAFVIKFWGSPIVPTFTSTYFTLLCVLGKSTTKIPSTITFDDSSALVFQHDDCNRSCKPDKGCHKCEQCRRLDHKIDWCYAYMAILLYQMWLPKLLPHNRLIWFPLYLISQDSMLSLMNFSIDMRIVRTLGPLLL